MSIFARKKNLPPNYQNLDDFFQKTLNFNFNNFNNIKNKLSIGNASIFCSVEKKINPLNYDKEKKILNFLEKQKDEHNDWFFLNEKASIYGMYGLLIYTNRDEICQIPVKIISITYNEFRSIDEIVIQYENLILDDSTFLFATYKKLDNKISIDRSLKKFNNGNWEKKDFSSNEILLQENEIIDINEIPIIILKNLPNAQSDALLVEEWTKVLDIIDGLIVMDPLVASTKIVINKNSMSGNINKEMTNMIYQLLCNQIIGLNYDPDVDPAPFSTISGVFKAKNLTDLRDWIDNLINKLAYMYVPSFIKAAQQSISEVSNVNIYAYLIFKMKKKEREFFIEKYVKILSLFDKKKIFDLTEDEINLLKVKLDIPESLNFYNRQNLNSSSSQEIKNE